MGKTLKLTDLNYNHLLFGKFLNEFTGIFGDYRSLGDDAGWFDLETGEILGNFEYSGSLMKTILTSQEPFFIISEDLPIDGDWERRIYLGAPVSLFRYNASVPDGYMYTWSWKHNRVCDQWEECTDGSYYYDGHKLEYDLLFQSIPIAFNFDMKKFDELLCYIRKKLGEGKAFYWR